MVAYPYTKRLVAVMDVDLAAAVVLASADAADRLGVPDDRARSTSGAGPTRTDPVYVAEHDELWRSPAMAWAFERGAGLGRRSTLDDVDLADLYSCFPSSVSFALDALGIGPDDRLAPFTVTGGLPYAGGAGLVLPAVVARGDGRPPARRRRRASAMVTGVGMHMTKHAVGGPRRPSAGDRCAPPPPDPGPAVRRPIVDVHHGPATVAAYTVHHGRDGAATDAVLVCDVDDDDGARCYAAVRDPDLLAALEAEEWVGRTVVLSDGGSGVNLRGGRTMSSHATIDGARHHRAGVLPARRLLRGAGLAAGQRARPPARRRHLAGQHLRRHPGDEPPARRVLVPAAAC